MYPRLSFRRTLSVARKELLHLRRDPATLFFALFIPILQLCMLGYAIDMNVRHIPTAVVDDARTQESRALLRAFETSDDFDVVCVVGSITELNEAIVAGKAHVGIKIPEDYSRQLQAGETAQILVLVDGSLSSVAAEAVNVGNAIALRESLRRALGDKALPVEVRPRVLFNPDTRSANFFVPGLLVVLCQMMATMLTANTIVREKSSGTLEQLFMTPVRPGELILGKLTPYLVLTFIEMLAIILLMLTVFRVPVHGALATLLAIALPFVLTMLGIGLLISTRASTENASMQLVLGTVVPSIFLSGYVFPTESMPWFFRQVSLVIPTTWLIDAARGVILRGAGWRELWPHATVLWAMAIGMLTLSIMRFHKKL
jgi:ABC-2 type transport system permease protein